MCGKCRFCNYEPVTVDAAICPRCCGWAPNPSILKRIGVIFSLILSAAFALGGAWLALNGDFGLSWIGLIGAVGFFKGLYRPYGGPQ